MEILEEGRPVRVEYRGRCTRCQCLVSCERHEIKATGTGNYVHCPTSGCGATITVKVYTEGADYDGK